MSPVIPSRVLLRLVTLFINAMIWVSKFFKSQPEPINHHFSPVFPRLSYSLAFGHSDSKKKVRVILINAMIWASQSVNSCQKFHNNDIHFITHSRFVSLSSLGRNKGGLWVCTGLTIWQYGNISKRFENIGYILKIFVTTTNLPTKY